MSDPTTPDPTTPDPGTPDVPATPDVPTTPDGPATPGPVEDAAQPASAPAPDVPVAPASTESAAPAYAAPSYPSGGPAYAPPAPDTRPKTLGIIALIVGIGGFILTLFGFVPVPVVGLVVTIVGGLALLVALVLGIVALASKKQGGKGFGIGALVVSVVGGLVWIGAIIVAILWIGLAAYNSGSSGQPSPAASAPSVEETPGGDTTSTADEQAYLDTVKPEVLVILQTIEPSLTLDDLPSVYSDDTLISMGQQLATIPEDQREQQRSDFVTNAVSSSNGKFTDETAGRMFDVLIAAADQYLAS